MRFVLAAALVLAFSAAAFAFDFPALTGRVVDQAGVMTPQARSDVEAKSKSLEDKSGIQLVVATVKSLQGSDIETYANQLFRFWKLGEAKKNNGVLFLVAPAEHKVRIEVGYGLEGTLTDALSSVIISSAIIPRFKANDFSGGIERGVDGIISVLSGDTADWQPKPAVRHEDPAAVFNGLFPFLFFVAIVLIFRFLFGSGSNTAGGRYVRRGGRTIFIPYSGGSSDSSWGGGFSGGGGGGFDGGGFSGGGGSSGGGGASGGW
ncbi:MAG TPA: TPM domain-containing protein [Xanthobacteraceae bacterium]|nr:TPM domain-containing protein [Xanthobacteraceae bacterium]